MTNKANLIKKSFDLSYLDKLKTNVEPYLAQISEFLKKYNLNDKNSMGIGALAGGLLGLGSQYLTEEGRNKSFGQKLTSGLLGAGLGAAAGGLGSHAYANKDKYMGYAKESYDDLKNKFNKKESTPAITTKEASFDSVLQHTIIPSVLIKEANIEKLNELVNQDPSFLSDLFLMPKARRATGRASATQEMLGENADLTLAYPTTTRVLASLLPAIAGGVGGAYLGDKFGKNNPEAQGKGIAIGSSLGAASGALIDTILRRKARKKVKDLLANEIANNTTAAQMADLEPGTLFGGVHQQGRADAQEAVLYGKNKFKGNPVLTSLAIANAIPGVNYVASLPYLIGDLAVGNKAVKRQERNLPTATRRAD